MPSKDLASNITIDLTVSSGDTVDLLDAESCVITLPVIDTTTITLTEGTDSGGSGATAVAAKFIVSGAGDGGTIADNVVTYGASGTANISYVGKQRYLTITIANPATDTTIGLIKGDLRYNPYS